MRIRLTFAFMLTACALATAQPAPVPIGHWPLDGSAKDLSPAAHDGKLTGHVEFFDSPVGANGKLLWFNGVDTLMTIGGEPLVSAGDFSVSLWVCPLDSSDAPLVTQGSGEAGWQLAITPDRAIRFRIGAATVETPAGRAPFGQWRHLVGVKSGNAIRLFVNGEATGETALPAAAKPASTPADLLVGGAAPGGPLFAGLVDDVQIYDRAINPDAVAHLTDAGLPWLRIKPHMRQPFKGHFSLEADDVVTFVGGEDATAAQLHGYLETLLTSNAAGRHVLFRDMAWEGDTVFEQWRILNFGPWDQQFERVGSTVLFVQFGQMESLAGPSRLADFVAAYEKLLDEFQKRTQRIVLLTPTPFQPSPFAGDDVTARNASLQQYASAIRALAEKRGLLCVDLFSAIQPTHPAHPLTRDGVHLSAYGQYIAARETARLLDLHSTDPVSNDPTPRFERRELELIRQTAIEKNELWMRYWRPPNWAFLNGDRVTQPSSRDDVDRRIRWLPAEVQKYAPMIVGKEKQIAEAAKGLQN